MAQPGFVDFLVAVRDDPAMLAKYHRKNLPQLIFHAGGEGFQFDLAQVATVIGKLEYGVIVDKDGDALSESSRLWREMWGRRRLEYLVDRLIRRFTDDELAAFALEPQPVPTP